MNPLVNAFGGRDGCLGYFYVLTPKEMLEEHVRRMKASERKLTREQNKVTATNNQLERDIRKLATGDKMNEAKQKALDLHRGEIEFLRLGKLRQSVSNVKSKLREQLQAVEIDRSLVLLVNVMGARLQVMNPERFTHMMQRYDQLKDMEQMNEDQLNEFFTSSLDEEMERAHDDLSSDEQRIAAVFTKLGVGTVDSTQFPDVPDHQVKNDRGPRGGGVAETIKSKSMD